MTSRDRRHARRRAERRQAERRVEQPDPAELDARLRELGIGQERRRGPGDRRSGGDRRVR